VILAAGLSPAWQQILVFDQLRIGEVNRAQEVHSCASGKVLNVAIAAHRLSKESSVEVISVLGGDTGEKIQSEFHSHGIPITMIQSPASTRVCTTLLDWKTRTTTELVENSSPLSANVWEEYLEAFHRLSSFAKIVVFTGSLPDGGPVDFLHRLQAGSDARWLLDIRGNELLSLLPVKPWLVKPNREELAATFQRDLNSEERLHASMREVIELGAESVLTTRGSSPALLAYRDEFWEFSPPEIQSVNPIGCGDSLAAGIAVATQGGKNLIEAVRFGIAAAANNAELLLPARLARQRVDELVPGVKVTRLA